jgi:hypothetical protein
MSCGCQTFQICVAGKTYNAFIALDPRGGFLSGQYLDENLISQPLTAGSFSWGSCALVTDDVYRIVQPLVAGDNIINHPLNKIPVEVEVRDATTGAIVQIRTINETATSVTIVAAVSMASVKISIDA